MDTFGPTKAICIKKDAQSKCLMTDKPSRPLPLKNIQLSSFFSVFHFNKNKQRRHDRMKRKTGPKSVVEVTQYKWALTGHPEKRETPGWHGLSKTCWCEHTNLFLFRTGKTSCFWNSHVQTCLCVCVYIYICTFISIMHSFPVGFRGNNISGPPFSKPKHLNASLYFS